MRRFIILTNEQLDLANYKVIAMKNEDIGVMFTNDVLNVLNENEQKQLLAQKNMYGIEVNMDNYLKAYRQFLKDISLACPDLICIFDASIKRYINRYEIDYFANNKLLPSKLFNIEIKQDETCMYETIGLESIGLKEFEFKANMYLNEEDFQIFKTVVTNFVIGKHARVYINGKQHSYEINETENKYLFNYQRPSKIYDFYFRDDQYLNDIRYNLIAHHWPTYTNFLKTKPQIGQYLINKAKINDIDSLDVKHVEEFVIVSEGINYNQDNLFYAYKYLD